MWHIYLYLPILSSWQTLLIDCSPVSCSVQGVPPQDIIPGSPYQSTPHGTCNELECDFQPHFFSMTLLTTGQELSSVDDCAD